MTDSPFSALSSLNDPGPGLTRFNPPGQPALYYRPGAYGTIVARMLDELRKQKVVDQDHKDQQPLVQFNILAIDDWTVAFLRAWATVSDVLSFYQERIINEGYLRTAIERRSILYLTRATGYELSPPISATTYLAFTAHDLTSAEEASSHLAFRFQDGINGESVTVPRGTAVQSVPVAFSSSEAIQDIIQGVASPAENLPVVFETTDDLLVNPAWNTLKPARIVGLPWPQRGEIRRTLRLAGINLGLKPGDGLLVVSGAAPTDSKEGWELLLLSEVSPQPKDNYTAVTWKQSFGSVPKGGVLNPTVHALRRKTRLFPYAAGSVFRKTRLGYAPTNIGLPPKGVRAATANRQGRLFVGIDQSVFSSRDRGDSWKPIVSGLPPKDIQALATSSSGALAVGTDDSGVFLSTDGGDGWTQLSGTGEVEIPKGWRRFLEVVRHKLPKTIIRSLLFTNRKGSELLAGSDDGVFGYNPRHASWKPMNGRFPNIDRKKGTVPLTVRALVAVDGGKRILAGTTDGVFPVETLFQSPSSTALAALLLLLSPSGLKAAFPESLEPIIDQYAWLLPYGVLLVFLAWLQPMALKLIGLLLAVLSFMKVNVKFDGIACIQRGNPLDFCFAGSSINMADATEAMTRLIIAFLAANVLFAGLAKLPGLVHKLPDIVQKLPNIVRRLLPAMSPSVKHPQVFCLVADKEVVYAGTDHGVFQLDRPTRSVRFKRWLRRLVFGSEPEPWTPVPGWVNLPLARDSASWTVTSLALDRRGRLVAGTQAGDIYVRLRQKNRWLEVGDVPLTSIRTLIKANDDFFATGAPVDAPGESRWAPAHLEASAIDVDDHSLEVPADSYAVALDAESNALFTVNGAVEKPSHDAKQGGMLTRLTVRESAELPKFNRAETQLFYQSEPLAFFDDEFLPQPVQGDQIILAGRVPGLQRGKLMAISGTTVKGQQHSELVTVYAAIPGVTKTIVQLEEPLALAYIRDSVTVYGNIVPAVQGQTIRRENLGESDGTILNQRFMLRSQLAYEPAAANDYKSSLTVYANNIPWKSVPTLLDQPPDGRVFMVRRNDQGKTAIIFGDGEQGARLPTSQEKLTATYRSGGGLAGNLPPNRLTLMQSQIPRLKDVTNPVPAEGGQPEETVGHGRRQAPRRLRALQRIVTLSDYGDFTATFPGVSKSAAHPRPAHAPRWIDIAIVPRHTPDSTASQADPLIAKLSEAIDQFRSTATLPVKLRSYQPVHFRLGLRVYLSPAVRENPDSINDLKRAVREKLLMAYSIEMQELGRPVTETEIFHLVQSVPGVTAVTLTELKRLPEFRKDEELEPPIKDKEEEAALINEGAQSTDFRLEADWYELLLLSDDAFHLEVAL